MTRVCMLAYTVYPADTRIRRYAEALVERGDEVDIVCPDVPSLGGRQSFHGVGVHTVMNFSDSGFERPIDYVTMYLKFVAAAGIKLFHLHRQRPYDVIHVHTMPDFLVFAAAGPKLLGSRVILDVHDLMPELFASKFGVRESHVVIRVIKAIERWSIRFADRAVAVHRPHLEALLRHGNRESKFTVLMNLPDPVLFAPRDAAPPERPFTLLYHGTVGKRHGLDVAVRSVALARSEIPDLRLRIIGDGDSFPQLRQLVAELGVEENVSLEQGVVEIERLMPVIRSASAGVVPILDDPFTRFMLPVKLLEYLAVGIPVIASRTDTIQSYFDGTTISLSTPGDPADVAAKIVELRRDQFKRAALSEAGRTWSSQHSWTGEKRKYYGLVDSLVSPRAFADTSHRESVVNEGRIRRGLKSLKVKVGLL